MSLRLRVTLLSSLVMLFIIIVLNITLVSLYSRHLHHNTDREIEQDYHAVKRSLNFDNFGRLDLVRQPEISLLTLSTRGDASYLVSDASGNPLRRSNSLIPVDLPVPAWETLNGINYRSVRFAGRNYRVLAVGWTADQHAGDQNLILQVTRPLLPVERATAELEDLLWLISPLPLLLVTLGGWWLAGSSLRPVKQLVDSINAIGAEDLHHRLEGSRQDEVGRIALAFNAMLDRVEGAFQALRQFTADASHELRTPLTVMRTQAEVALGRSRSQEEYRDILGSLLEDMARLEHMIESLLQLARADAGLLDTTFTRVDMSELVNRWLDNFRELAEARDIRLESDIGAAVMLPGDATALERIITNLLDNAIRFTPQGGTVSVSLGRDADHLMLGVCDTGPGIPADLQERVFDRFTRLQSTRHIASGAGLGLAIVHWAVALHHGSIHVNDNTPQGACFLVTLPIDADT